MSTAPRTHDSDSPNRLTVEQLAAESGMSVRNIRAHQARGLLSPPEVRHRVGYYGPEHLAQLRLIRDLQADGFNLNGIKRLVEDGHATAERLLRFREALSAGPRAEPAETLSISELGRRFRVSAAEAPELLAKAVALGVLTPVSADRYEVPSPSLLAIAEEVAKAGIPVRSTLAALEEIQGELDEVSRSVVQLFLEGVWKPFARADMPAERWPAVEQAVERLRPIASEALMAIFEQRLGSQIRAAFAEITRRLAERGS
ncbi:MAG: MerR family transcriptional regulator [Solirubrobacterales bacterium]|nr:MerR family transcriptional regulator [Solirubrobacterales bacterium]MBV9716378.1 MerR family transcriptional regulator [Solirubrobacterales bacterium]